MPVTQVVEQVDLVLLRNLPRQIRGVRMVEAVAAEVLLRQIARVRHQHAEIRAAGRSGAILGRVRELVQKGPGQVFLGCQVAVPAVEPQPILEDRATHRRVHFGNALDPRARVEPLRDELVRQVVALQTAVGEIGVEVVREPVAAVLGHRVGHDAARAGLGRRTARHDGHFLDGAGVDGERVVVAAARVVHVVERHAVQQERHLVVAAAVHFQRLPAVAVRATDILIEERHLHARHEDRQILERPSRRQFVEDLAGECAALRGRLDVDERRLARHGDGLFDRSDRERAVNSRRERGVQDDPLADGRVEARQRERDLVFAGTERNHAVLSLAVGVDHACALDERRAGRLDRDPGKHGAARVADHARDLGRLRGARGGKEQEHHPCRQQHNARRPSHPHNLFSRRNRRRVQAARALPSGRRAPDHCQQIRGDRTLASGSGSVNATTCRVRCGPRLASKKLVPIR